jgi:DNA-binding transcriptional regulator YbjK
LGAVSAAPKLASASPETSRREAILRATLHQIGSEGLQAVRHRAVAALAGVSTSSVAYHFPSRDDLLRAALEHAAREEIGMMQLAALELQGDAFDTRRWIERLVEVVGGAMTEQNRVRWLASYELQLASARDPEVRAVMSEVHASYTRACELGFLAAGSRSPELHGRILVDVLAGAMLKQLAYPTKNFVEETLRPVVSDTVYGLIELPRERASAAPVKRSRRRGG